VRDLLTPAAIKKVGIFSPAAVAGLVRRCESGRATGFRENQALLGALSTQLWHHQFVDSRVSNRALDIAAADVVITDGVPAAV
jgi:hypothetical protein